VHAVELVLGPEADDAVTAAARAAVARARVELAPRPVAVRSAWWSAGLADAVDRGPSQPSACEPDVAHPDVARLYDAARSPRSTLGATRA
jgi:hypothetical protein